MTYIGGLFTDTRARGAESEWLMTVPDTSMASDVDTSRNANARTLQQGSAAMYALVSDTTSSGHAWLPSTMPDGNYQGPQPDASDNDQQSSDDDLAQFITMMPALLAAFMLA